MAGELHNPLAQALQVALAIVTVLGAELLNAAVHGVVHDLGDVVGQVLAVQNLIALSVDDLALLVHDVVVLKDALAHGEVDALDLVLGALDGLGDDLVLDGHVVAHVGRDHHLGDAVHLVAAEQAHEVVLERQVELGLARIALTAGTAAQLVVDTAGIVALGADNGQAAGGKHALALGLQVSLASALNCSSCSGVTSSMVRPSYSRRSRTSSSGLPPNRMSVPRPAMLVAMVTAP